MQVINDDLIISDLDPCAFLICRSKEELDWGAPMAWGWPFLLRLAAAHRRRRHRSNPFAQQQPLPPHSCLPASGMRTAFIASRQIQFCCLVHLVVELSCDAKSEGCGVAQRNVYLQD